MVHTLKLENIKCGGCVKTIISKLSQFDDVTNAVVDYEQGTLTFDSTQTRLAEIKSLLLSLGYPEEGSVEGLNAVGAKAKSFVSCAIGKMSKD
ncbi:heavy-metal-associated domain-containing protein [Thiomicrospira sp. R3]|uniref:heavy-metal-associated domain-containing protein n=1 Tax=Thiomicrospira sp. R3 TaxID=3035472 RepID=UPI00259BDAC6|nr:heavy-metal-associated domain-containing protein [Thiomicrospira sp. R3]WFE68045.1 heavy-metal-associated domain-containing protein [Thiomicrospira sp. R3]